MSSANKTVFRSFFKALIHCVGKRWISRPCPFDRAMQHTTAIFIKVQSSVVLCFIQLLLKFYYCSNTILIIIYFIATLIFGTHYSFLLIMITENKYYSQQICFKLIHIDNQLRVLFTLVIL